jgi:hypothetical protein
MPKVLADHSRLRTVVAALLLVMLALGGCGGGGGGELGQQEQRQLPLMVGDLIALCTKLPSEWHSAAYQRTRRTRLRQADALIAALGRHPDAKVRAHFIDADSGDTVSVSWTVKHLAAEQIAAFDAAHYCTRPGTPTSPEAARAALARIATIRRLANQP